MIYKFSQEQSVYLSFQAQNILSSLDDWSIICVTGRDKKKYLNSQFTIDVLSFHKNKYYIGAHCGIQGKVWTTFLIFKYYNCYLYILRSSVCSIHIKELKKYSIFSEVNIFQDTGFCLYGLYGSESYILLERFFSSKIDQEKKIVLINNFIILKLNKPIERFLIIIPKKELVFFLEFMKNRILFSNSLQWQALDIESNFPVFDILISGRFVLQSLDLKKWNAINFNKGCYYGQEALCKYENKKINKFVVCALIGKFNSCLTSPKVYEYIEYVDVKGHIYYAGIVLSWVLIFRNKILLQVRMKKFFFQEKNIFILPSCPNISFKIYFCDF